MDSLRKLFNTPTLVHLVRVGRLELPASCSQSKRATNCATPGYEVFQLWSNIGSTPVFDQFPARGKTPSALAPQRFPGFQESAARTPASRSQTGRVLLGEVSPCSLPTDGSVLFYFTGFPRKVKSIPAAFFAPLEKTGRRRGLRPVRYRVIS